MSLRWPFFDLRLQVADLELRVPDLTLLDQLARLTSTLLDAPGLEAVDTPWAQKTPVEAARDTMKWHWKNWGELTPELWRLLFVITRDGVVLGVQEIGAKDFPIVREVDTGSWVGRPYQGQGLGKLARSAVLSLAFEHLGALGAHTGASGDNLASVGVSKSLGYGEDGVEIRPRRGIRTEGVRMRMTAEQWRERQRPAVEVIGLEPCLTILGLTS